MSDWIDVDDSGTVFGRQVGHLELHVHQTTIGNWYAAVFDSEQVYPLYKDVLRTRNGAMMYCEDRAVQLARDILEEIGTK